MLGEPPPTHTLWIHVCKLCNEELSNDEKWVSKPEFRRDKKGNIEKMFDTLVCSCSMFDQFQ